MYKSKHVCDDGNTICRDFLLFPESVTESINYIDNYWQNEKRQIVKELADSSILKSKATVERKQYLHAR